MGKYKMNKSGFYCTRLSTGEYDKEGRLKTVFLRAKTVAELEELVAEARQHRAKNLSMSDSSVHFIDYAELWFETDKDGVGLNTKKMYRNILDKHLDNLAHMRLRDITHNHVQKRVNDLKDRPVIQRQFVLTVNAIFESAVLNRLLAYNPCGNLRTVDHQAKHKRPLTAFEKKRIREADLDPMRRAFVDTLLGTGMRPGELYALTWKDVDFHRHLISVNKSLIFDGCVPVLKPSPKTKAGVRELEAPDFVFESLRAFKTGHKHDIIFCDETGAYRTKASYLSIFDTAMKQVFGFSGKNRNQEDHLTMYTFRHSYCTDLVASGMDLKTVQRLMGHNSTQMIMQVYAHANASHEAVAGKLNNIFAKPSGGLFPTSDERNAPGENETKATRVAYK